MSLELIDKGVSTEDLDVGNVDKKEVQKQNSKEEEKKETTDLDKLEAVLSALVENKVTSIRNYGKRVKEKKLLFNKFRTKSEEVENAPTENKINKYRANSSSTLISYCKCGCHHYDRRSLVPCEASDYCQSKIFAKYPQTSIESSHHLNMLCPQQSFESYDASLFYKPSGGFCCGHRTELERRLDRKKLSVQKCLPKRLSTEQWLNSTSRQTSTETATTSSGYISPTFGTGNRKNRSGLSELDAHQLQTETEVVTDNGDNETIIEMSKIQAQETLDEIDESQLGDKMIEPKDLSPISVNELESVRDNNNKSEFRDNKNMCNDSCHILLPQCLSTTCLPYCRYPMVEDQGCYNDASYRHLHHSGGHYVSCCNSPTHSFQ